MSTPRIEINGGPATADQLAYPAIANYGHFTAMQVRAGAVRGQVDDQLLPTDPEFTRTLTEAYESVPWDPI